MQIASAFVQPRYLSKTIIANPTALHIKISDLKKNNGAASNRAFRYTDNERSSSSNRPPSSTRGTDDKEERPKNGSQTPTNRYGTRSARKNLFSHNLPMTVSGSESMPSDSMPGGSSMPYGNVRTDRPAFTYGPEIPKNPLFDHNKPVTRDKNDPRQSVTPYAGYGSASASKQQGNEYDHGFTEKPPANEERYDQAYPYSPQESSYPYSPQEPSTGSSYGRDDRDYSAFARGNDNSQHYSEFRYDSSNTPPREDNRGNQYVGDPRRLYERDNEPARRNFDYDYAPQQSQPMATSNNYESQTSTYDQERSRRSFDFGPTCSVVQDCKSKGGKYEEAVDEEYTTENSLHELNSPVNVEYAPENSLYEHEHNSPVTGGAAFNDRQPFHYGPSGPSSAPLFDHNTPVTHDKRQSYPGRAIDSPYVRSPDSSPHNNFSYGPESSIVTDCYDSGKSYYDEQIDGDYEKTWRPPVSDTHTRPSQDAGQRRQFSYGPGTNDVSSNGAYGLPEPFSHYVEPNDKESVENNYGNSLIVLNDENNRKPFHYGGSDPTTKPLFDHNKPVVDSTAFNGDSSRQPFHYGSSDPSTKPLFDHNRPVTDDYAMNVKSYAPQYRNNIKKANLEQTSTTLSSSAGMDNENDFECRKAEYNSAIKSLDCLFTETAPKLSAMVNEATEALSALERWTGFVRRERERLD